MTDRVRCFLRYDGEVLACRRDDDALDVPTGPCDDPSADDEPAASGEAVLRDRFGIECGLDHVRTGSPLSADDATYYPALFDYEGADLPDEGGSFDDAEWLSPTAFAAGDAAPNLWSTYERVAPTVRSVAADDEHGASYLSIRALEILRDRAALQLSEGDEDPDELRDLGQRLLRVRPSMAVLHNRVNRVLAAVDGVAAVEAGTAGDEVEAARGEMETTSDEDVTTAEQTLDAAIREIERALAADADAAAAAAETVADARVLTLSRSGTVLSALRRGAPNAVYVAESRPAREGIDVAETLADDADPTVIVHTDAAVGHVVATEDVDAVLVGADAVLPDGSVVNKTGTRVVALVAKRADVPVYAAAASDKITHEETVNLESGDAAAVYDGDADLDVRNPTFDVTPSDLLTGVVTERGTLDPDGVREIAEDHAALADWQS